MASILDLDPRWRALMAKGGVIDIGFDHPSEWPHAPRGDLAFVKEGADQLASELCRLDETRYLRAIFNILTVAPCPKTHAPLWPMICRLWSPKTAL